MARVLVVDDNKLIRALLSQVLMDAGHEVVLAEDGKQALVQLEREPLPDLVVTDFYMPLLDGECLTKMIRADPKMRRIPVIGLAGTADSEKRLTEAGVDVYLQKPLKDDLFSATVTNILAKPDPTKK